MRKSGGIVWCISPLIALMIDQSLKYSSCGLCAGFIGSGQTCITTKKKVLDGQVQLIFTTPEAIILNPTFRNMLLFSIYKEKLFFVAVDEAHCVKLWELQFRSAFSQIGICEVSSQVEFIF